MHDRRRWFLAALAILTVVAVADLYWDHDDYLIRFAKGFSVVEGPRVRIR